MLPDKIFKLLSPAADNLFYSRNDPDDRRLGDVVLKSYDSYDSANYVILGSPQDIGVERNRGRTGAEKAPDEIRTSLYKLSASENILQSKLMDLGNIKISDSLEAIHQKHEEIISALLEDHKKLIVLGGGNDISYPDCKALSKHNRRLLVLNVDSHPDVRPDNPRNSGTSYRMLLEEELIDGNNFFEIGVKPFSASIGHKKYLESKDARLIMLDEVKKRGMENILDEILNQTESEVIFWGFDMDVVSNISAPGVSAAFPTGISAEEAVAVAKRAGKDERTRIFEISEVNPEFDIDNRTSKLAAVMIWHFLNER